MRSPVCAARLAAGGAIAAALVFARPARAFCRTVTEAPPADWNLATQGCFAGSAGAKALYWKNVCVGYSLQKEASRQVTLEQATAVVAQAFEAWSSAACGEGGRPSLRAFDQGPVVCGKVQYNKDQANQNVIVFRDDAWPYSASSSTLGITTLTFDTTTGEILGADMEINATQNLVVGDPVPAGSFDVASIVTHEIGHFLGLAHSADASAVMFAQHKAGAAHLTRDDADGLCALYAPDGTRATSNGRVAGTPCDPTPPHGFSSACASPGGTTVPDDSESGGACAVSPRAAWGGWGAAGIGLSGLALLVLRRRSGGPRRARWSSLHPR